MKVKRREGVQKVIAVLRETLNESLELLEVCCDHDGFLFLRLEHRDRNFGIGTRVDLSRQEFISLLRVGLDYLTVDRKVVDSVLPKLTKANIVK